MVQVKDGIEPPASWAIGEVAAIAGIAPSAIRFYERNELLPAPERSSGQRRYDGSVFPKLAMIRVAQDAGFSLAEIRTLLDGLGDDRAPSQAWRTLAEAKIADVDALISRAQAMRRLLDDGLRCECLSLDDRDDFAAACGDWATTRNDRQPQERSAR